MSAVARTTRSFPSVRIPSRAGGLPVEVVLVAQIGIGAGTPLVQNTAALQRGHHTFVDALDEPSARIGGADFDHDDPSSLYTFTVGAKGHPFHRHAGNRVFTAVSGSAGARLRFSTASSDQVERDPHAFIDALRQVDIPPDCLFTVRFGGGTWHQFLPADPTSGHPALFALSCHTNELGGALDTHQRAQVLANDADIPSLTELLPEAVQQLLAEGADRRLDVPTISLSLNEQSDSLRGRFCAHARVATGRARAAMARVRAPVGFFADHASRRVQASTTPAPHSLLLRQFDDVFDPTKDHQDYFVLEIDGSDLPHRSASQLLAGLLDGFLENRPTGVSRLMRLRNTLVRPFGLRTSQLGCPVSSLLNVCPQQFAGRFPVLDQAINDDDRRAQVILGADDKHLRFRSCVGVEIMPDGKVCLSLGTRVCTRNLFGRLYMRSIDRAHRAYIAPTMLRMAVLHLQVASFDGQPAKMQVAGAL